MITLVKIEQNLYLIQKDRIIIGFIKMKEYNQFLLINEIQLLQEYQHQHFGSEVISILLKKYSFIFGESTKRAYSFWNHQILEHSGIWYDNTICHNTYGSFIIPEKKVKNSVIHSLLEETYFIENK